MAIIYHFRDATEKVYQFKRIPGFRYLWRGKMIELLKMFCADTHGPAYDLTSPFSEENYTYATDGWICIRVERVKEITRTFPFPSIEDIKFIPENNNGKWIEIPELPDDIISTCEDCKGSGVVILCPECEGEGEVIYCGKVGEYEIDCPACDAEGVSRFKGLGEQSSCRNCSGTGKTKDGSNRNRKIGETRVRVGLLHDLKRLPDIELYACDTFNKGSVNFRFDGGVGVVMGLDDRNFAITDEG